MSRRRSFRRGARLRWLRPLVARVAVLLVLVAAVMLTVRCTRELDPARSDGGLALIWKAEPGVPVATADSARTWVLDGQDRILVGPVVAPFDVATGSFDISLRVPAGDDRAVRMQLEGSGARGRGVMAEGETRGIAVAAATTAEAHLRLRNAVPRMKSFTGQPGDLQITLRWSAVAGASSYRLYRRPSAGPEQIEEVGDTVRVFELSDRVRWSEKTGGTGAGAGGATKTRGWPRLDAGMSRPVETTEVPRNPAVLDTTWFRVSAILHDDAVSVASDAVAVSFGWIEDTPHVLPGGVVPAAGATDVPDSVAVEIEFDRPMDPLSLGDVSVPSLSNAVTLGVDGTTDLVGLAIDSSSWSDDGRRLRLRPVAPLRRDAVYLLQVTTDLRDLDGRPLDQSRTEAGLQVFASRFDTEDYDPLRVTAAVPVGGATGVLTRPLIEIQLNRQARPATVNAQTVLLADSAGNAVACAVTLPQASVIRVAPGPPLRFGTRYQLTVTTEVRDLRGRGGESLDQDPGLVGVQPFITSFRTVPQPSGPRVVAVTPVDGEGSVPVGQVVRVTFSRPVQAATVTGNFTVRKLPVGAQISGVLAVSSADRTEFTFTPTQLDRGISYRVVVAAGGLDPEGDPVGIRDDLGIPFDQDSTIAAYQEFNSLFRVENCPQVSSVTPADGRDHVPVDTLVTLRFSLPVARSSVTSENLGLLAGASPVSLRPLMWSADSTLVRLQPEGSFSFYRSYAVLADTSLRSTRGSRFDQYPTQPGYQPFRSEFLTSADGIPPRVASWTPGDDAIGVSTATPVTVHFTKPIIQSSVLSEGNFFLQRKLPPNPRLDATRAITSDSLVATLWPTTPLENDVEYQVTVTKFVEDRFGQQLDQDPAAPFNQDFTGRFRTDIERVPPRVAGLSPYLGESGVQVNAAVEVIFSEPMRADETLTGAFTLTGPGGVVAGSPIPSPDGLRLVFTPDAPLRYAVRFDVRVDTTAADLAGNRLDQQLDGERDPFESWFTTARDDVPPRVLAWVPPDGATTVKVTVHPEVTFDEAMAVSTLPGGLRLLDSGGEPVALLPPEIPDDRHAFLIPADRLRFAELYTLEANEAALDSSGNRLDQDRVMPGPQPSRVSFRTEDFPPRVAAVFPARDSSGVDPGVVVEVRFAAPVDPATVVVPAFAVYPDGGTAHVSGTILSGSDIVFSFQPDAPLAPDSQYWIRISTQVADHAGNPYDDDPDTPAPDSFESGFRTGTPPVAQAGDGICDPTTSVVTLAASASKPDDNLSLAEITWGDGTAVETITIPGPQWPSPSHPYTCPDIRGCNREDDDQDGTADETGSAGCDESYQIRLRVLDKGGLWSAWDPTGVSFCNLQVLSSTPAAGAAGVDTLLTELRLRFTRPLLADSVVAAHFTLVDGSGLPVNLTAALASDPDSFHVVILTPLSLLQPGMTYTVQALPGIRSADNRDFDQDPCMSNVQSFEAVFHTQLGLVPLSPPSTLSPPPSSGSPAQEGRARRR
jgi:hypothetical protein